MVFLGSFIMAALTAFLVLLDHQSLASARCWSQIPPMGHWWSAVAIAVSAQHSLLRLRTVTVPHLLHLLIFIHVLYCSKASSEKACKKERWADVKSSGQCLNHRRCVVILILLLLFHMVYDVLWISLYKGVRSDCPHDSVYNQLAAVVCHTHFFCFFVGRRANARFCSLTSCQKQYSKWTSAIITSRWTC